MTRPNMGVYSTSWRYFQILFHKNFEKKWFVTDLRRRARIFPLPVSAVQRSTIAKFWLVWQLAWQTLGPSWDPSAGPRSVVVRRFNPLHVRICVGTILTKVYPKSLPYNVTTKHCDTPVQLRLVSGRSWAFDLQTLQ